MRSLSFEINEEFDGKKVIHYLRGKAHLSSRLINSLKPVADGIMLNGVHTRTVDILHKGDVLTVNIPDDSSEIQPTKCDFEIVYEDEDVLVINKPGYVAMHPTHNHQGDTLANGVADYFAKKNKTVAFRAVGRLDKGTSGLVLCALNKYAASRLSGNFKKEYFAVVKGKYEGFGTIDKKIYRPDPMKTLRAAGEKGDDAVTHWQSLWTDSENSFLRINLETGRTHQIRVHFSSMGTPLAGDNMYGSDDNRISRPALHCGKLGFVHPVTEKIMNFSVPLPADMASLLPSEAENAIIL